MLSGIGDIEVALKLVRQMRVEAGEIVDVFRKLVSKAESLFPAEDFEHLKGLAANVESVFTRVLALPAEDSADLLTQIDELCEAISLFSPIPRKALDEVYDAFAMAGVDAKKREKFKAMSERVNNIRIAQQSIDQLSAAGVPAQLLTQVSQSLIGDSADRVEAYVEAQLALNEPGHLGDRLAKFLELMERSGLSSFDEKQKHGEIFAYVDTAYELLSHMELLRDLSERLTETVQIDALRALKDEAHRIRDVHLKLMAVGDALDVEARLGDFLAITNLPAKT